LGGGGGGWLGCGAGGDGDGVSEANVSIAGPSGLWFCFTGRGGRGIDGEGETVFVVGDFVDAIGGMDVELQIMLLVKGLEAGLHEAGEGAELAVVDVAVGEGFGDGVEIGEDGGVVVHVNEVDQRAGGFGIGGHGLALGLALALEALVAEVVAVEGGHGAARAIDACVATTRFHGVLLENGFKSSMRFRNAGSDS
jgi:hypothetical protein